MKYFFFIRTGLLLVIALCFSATAALSVPLGKATSCKTLTAQRNALAVLGVKDNMKQGAVWAKNNLADVDLYLVRNYISIDERIRFRCAAPPVKKVVKRRSRKRTKKKKR